MASIVEDLKGKLSEIEARIMALRAEIVTCEQGKAAFETVITFYDPQFTSTLVAKRQPSDRSTPARKVTDLLKGRDVRRGVLQVLRDEAEPIYAADITQKFLQRERIGDLAEGLLTRLAERLSTVLKKLEGEDMVRGTDAPDGRRKLWAIAR